MTNSLLYTLWSGFFILCAGLGFIPDPSGTLQAAMTAASLLFFLPPGILLYRAGRNGDTGTRKLIRNLSALSLTLTPVLLILNFLTTAGSEQLGTMLYYILVIVTSPMICSGHWATSLFFWACLLMASLRKS